MVEKLILPESLKNKPQAKILDTPEKVKQAYEESEKKLKPIFDEYAKNKRKAWVKAKNTVLD